MTEFETFEVSITSLDGKYPFLSSSLENVAINETFQSLFDRLIESLSQKDDIMNLNKTLLSPLSNNDNSPTPSIDNTSSSLSNGKIMDKIDLKAIECQCFSNLNTKQNEENGCNVSLQFNIHSICKRHNFLRIVYRMDIPSSSTSPPPMATITKRRSNNNNKEYESKRYSKFHELASHLNKSRSAQSRVRSKGITRTKYKIYKKQESLLTLLFVVPEFKSMYFIFLAGFSLFFTSIVIDDFMNKGEVFHSLSLVKWNFTRYNQVFQAWIYQIIYCFVLVLLFYSWKHDMYGFGLIKSFIPNKKQRYKHYNDYIYVVCYAIYMIPLFIYPAIWSQQFNIAGSLIVACEQTRFILKSHAFFVETFKTKRYFDRKREEFEKKQESDIHDIHDVDDEKAYDDDDGKIDNLSFGLRKRGKSVPSAIEINNNKMIDKSENTPSWLVDIDMNLPDLIVSFAYFLFIPMLVYRTSYPRTKKIKWNRVLQHFRDVLLSFCAVWVIFCRFCIPIYRKSTSDPGNFTILFSDFINGSLPGMMLLLLGFFGFLHSWLNLFAELLRFGDRQFYQDWWNARSFAQYYRKWNCVVHDWIYNYMYLPVIEAGYSKTFAAGVVFGTSSIIHEYILSVGCKFCFPLLLIMFGGLGVFFVPLTRLWRNAKFWNIFLWSMLLIGQGILLVLYSREYYARTLNINDPSFKFIHQNSWIPHSIQLFMKRDEILSLSHK